MSSEISLQLLLMHLETRDQSLIECIKLAKQALYLRIFCIPQGSLQDREAHCPLILKPIQVLDGAIVHLHQEALGDLNQLAENTSTSIPSWFSHRWPPP